MNSPPNPAAPSTRTIQLAEAADGSLLYLVPFAASTLPPIAGRDLRNAWDAARQAARHGAWGVPRCFRFAAPDRTGNDGGDGTIDIALTDADARSWAAAADARAGLHTRHGLSLGLRLLALIDLLTRSAAARRFVTLEDGEAALHPALVAAAACTPLDPQARFADESLLAVLTGACELLPPVTGTAP